MIRKIQAAAISIKASLWRNKAQHRYIDSGNNSNNKSINSQSRMLRSSQNDSLAKKLYVQIRDLRDDSKMSIHSNIIL